MVEVSADGSGKILTERRTIKVGSATLWDDPANGMSGGSFSSAKPGRPRIPKRDEILDAAARLKAAGRGYTKLAAKFDLTPKQLIDLIGNDRAAFNKLVDEYSTTHK